MNAWSPVPGTSAAPELIARHGEEGAFPPPYILAGLDLDLPGRKGEYLRPVADAALDGLLERQRSAR